MNWDEYFTNMLGPVAAKSKDKSRQVGAIVVGASHNILSTGFNGLPRGCHDYRPERDERPEKYYWYEHAERNAIYNAARHGVRLEGATLYVNLFPCVDCARAVVQAGVKRVCAPSPDLHDKVFGEQFKRSIRMMSEAGVAISRTPSVISETPKPRPFAPGDVVVTQRSGEESRVGVVVTSCTVVDIVTECDDGAQVGYLVQIGEETGVYLSRELARA